MRALDLLRDAARGLRHHQAQATLVAHGGLALALAAALLVGLLALAMAQVAPEIPEPERVVMLDFKGNPPGQPSDWFNASPLFFGPALQARGAPLRHIARTQESGFTLRRRDGRHEVFPLLLADPALRPLLGLRAQHGDLAAALAQPDAVAITPHLVQQLWGELPPEQALGRLLSSGGVSLRVVAILPRLDSRHPLHGQELLARLDGQANRNSPQELEALYRINGRVFARLHPGAQPEQLGGWMRAAFLAHPKFGELPQDWSAGREPAFFRAITLRQQRMESQGLRWLAVAALGAASALLVLMAAINALNLRAAQLLQRQRETAVRRSLGAARADLLRLWACEQALALLAAGAAATLLAWWLAPGLLAWLGLPPDLALFSVQAWPALLAALLLLGLLLPLTLVLPAVLALRSAPARALQGRKASEGPWGRRLRQGLLALQLGGALLLLALTGILGQQYRHLLHADQGYTLHKRLLLDVFASPADAPRFVPLVQAITRHPAVQHWAFSDMVPPWGRSGSQEHHRRAGGEQGGVLRVNRASPSFFSTYGIRVLAGDPLQATRGEARIVLDEEAARQLGFARPQQAVGELVLGGGDHLRPGQEARRVVAVVAAARLETGRDVRQPRAYLLSDDYFVFLTLHGADLDQLRAAVEQLWKQHDLPFAYRLDPVQVQREQAYQQEGQLAGLLACVALLAVAVAGVGAYALVADTLRRRRTELVLRRLHGAGHLDMVRSVVAEFRTPMLLALLFAAALSLVLGQLYLDGFVDRVPVLTGQALPMAAAALLTLLVLAAAVWRHTRLALRLRPIEALG